MNVSWKQSSASERPTADTKKRHTTSRCASRKRWKGGSAGRRDAAPGRGGAAAGRAVARGASALEATAFTEGERGLVYHLADDPPQHQPRRVADPLDVLAERREEALGARGRHRRGGVPSRELDQARLAERGQHVEAHRASPGIERVERPRADEQ